MTHPQTQDDEAQFRANSDYVRRNRHMLPWHARLMLPVVIAAGNALFRARAALTALRNHEGRK